MVNKLNDGLIKVMSDPAFLVALQAMKVNLQLASTSAETDSYLNTEVQRWSNAIKSANVTIN